LNIPESFLISRFNHLKIQKRYKRDRPADPDKPSKNSGSSAGLIKKGQWQAEEGVIALLLMNDITISRQILEQVSAADFVNDEYRLIFEKITTELEELGRVDMKVLQQQLESDQNSPILSRLMLFEINHPEKLAADCIYKIRKWSLDSRFNEIKRHINDEASSPDAVLHYMKELTEIRNKLTDIARERDKYLKSEL
jgi:replicative DNA helicase